MDWEVWLIVVDLSDTSPRTPGWFFRTLADELAEQRPRMNDLWERYKGRPPLPDLGDAGADRNRQRVWRSFQQKARTNYYELAIAAVLERLTPTGFRLLDPDIARTPPGLRAIPQPTSSLVDAAARRIWAGNDMGVQGGDILEKFLVMGRAYGMVGAPDPADDPNLPIITAEDPREVATYHDPVRPSRVLAALKLSYDDELECDVAWLYLPGRAIRATRGGTRGVSSLGRKKWRWNPADWQTVTADERELPTSLGNRVPVVRFENRSGEGEFEGHLDHFDRINHMLLQRIVIATLQAFRQRAVKGIPDKDPKTGKTIDYTDVFTNDPGALWLLPATAEMWESGQVDLSPILQSVKDDVRDLAAVMRLPVQHFIPDSANQSAEGASSGREGLVFRAEDRQIRGGSGFERLMALGFAYLQDADRSDPLRFETLWRPIERWSLNERATAAEAAGRAGVPWESVMTDFLQYEPDQIPLLRRQRADDQLLAPLPTDAPQRGVPSTGVTARTQFTSDPTTPSAPTSAGQTGVDPTGTPASGAA